MAGTPFRTWTIEKQYAFAAELPALIEEYSQKPGFYIPPSLEEVLSHSYGLPAEEDLTQQQAQEAAIASLLALGQETEEELRAATWTFSFLTDDRMRPSGQSAFTTAFPRPETGFTTCPSSREAEKSRWNTIIWPLGANA